MGRLYVIGNGFDLHHRIPSSYSAFGEYLQVADPDAYENVEQYLYLDSDNEDAASEKGVRFIFCRGKEWVTYRVHDS